MLCSVFTASGVCVYTNCKVSNVDWKHVAADVNFRLVTYCPDYTTVNLVYRLRVASMLPAHELVNDSLDNPCVNLIRYAPLILSTMSINNVSDAL